MEQTLLCKECRHSFKQLSEWFFPENISLRCRRAFHPAEIKIDPVTGPKQEPEYYDRCSTQRLSLLRQDQEHCGPKAVFWEPRHKKGLFKLIAKEHQ
jgi:hypothetical protein